MALPALAALFGRIGPALAGVLGRGGAAGAVGRGAAGEAGVAGRGGLGASLDDILSAGRKPRTSSRGGMPSAADLLFAAPPKGGVIDKAQRNDEIKAAGKRQSEIHEDNSTKLQKFGEYVSSASGALSGQIKVFFRLSTLLHTTYTLLEKFSGAMVESNRGLSQWNGKLAASFAQLDILKMKLDIKTAAGTSGTGSALNRAYGDLLTEMQPITQGVTQLMNVAGIIAARIGQGVAWLQKHAPVFQAMEFILGKIEENTDDKSDPKDPLRDFLGTLRNAPGGRPGAFAPLAPIGPKAPLPPVR